MRAWWSGDLTTLLAEAPEAIVQCLAVRLIETHHLNHAAQLTAWRAQVTPQEFIALFPQELQRDSESQWLRRAFHDIPLNEPALVQAATREPKKPWYESLRASLSKAIRIRL